MAISRVYSENEVIFQEKPVRVKDLTGLKFGRLTVLGYAGDNKRNAWFCRCSCGNTIKPQISTLKSGKARSCGCLSIELVTKRSTKHGHTKGNKLSSTYRSWMAMRRRCYDQKNKRFPNYGGRGITVCERWGKFVNFLEDMGERPIGLTIDRIDNDGDYCKENCRWANCVVQNNNKSINSLITFQGETKTMAQWEREKGLSKGTIRNRIRIGWEIERVFSEPCRFPLNLRTPNTRFNCADVPDTGNEVEVEFDEVTGEIWLST